MSLLLDTQSLLWYVLDDPKLKSEARKAIESEADRVYVSPASLWEIAIKIGLGKYSLDEPFEPFWERVIPESNFVMLPIEIRHTARLLQLAPIHRDPFDRLLVAQALADNLSLVSSDVLLDRYGVHRIW